MENQSPTPSRAGADTSGRKKPWHWALLFSLLQMGRMDWLDLLEVQGTLKSLLQHRSSKASILWPDTPGSPEGNTEGPGNASSEPLLPS